MYHNNPIYQRWKHSNSRNDGHNIPIFYYINPDFHNNTCNNAQNPMGACWGKFLNVYWTLKRKCLYKSYFIDDFGVFLFVGFKYLVGRDFKITKSALCPVIFWLAESNLAFYKVSCYKLFTKFRYWIPF